MVRIFLNIAAFFRRLFGRRQPDPLPVPGDRPLQRNISLIIIDPVIHSRGGQRLSQVLGWNNADQLILQLIDDLQEASHGYASFRITERIVVDSFALKADGFQYTEEGFLQAWSRRSGFHQPDAVDYQRLLADHDIVAKVNTGDIDEVWTISYPYAGFYESRMAGPRAFWCNAPPLEHTDAKRRFIIMAYNYERGVGEMLESFGHRAESIMAQVFQGKSTEQNLWQRFIRHEQTHPGQAEVGNIHFAPNSRQDYDWGNPSRVTTRCRTWVRFPDLSGEAHQLDCREWGGGDIRAHHRWWFRLLPHVQGQTNGITNNWWEYILDPNRVA